MLRAIVGEEVVGRRLAEPGPYSMLEVLAPTMIDYAKPELAGEMSGHFFFAERWYGFDDGIYAAARLLEILANRAETPSEVLAELPDSVSTPEIKVPVQGDRIDQCLQRVVRIDHRRRHRRRVVVVDGEGSTRGHWQAVGLVVDHGEPRAVRGRDAQHRVDPFCKFIIGCSQLTQNRKNCKHTISDHPEFLVPRFWM